jgi:hypothetical protein
LRLTVSAQVRDREGMPDTTRPLRSNLFSQ